MLFHFLCRHWRVSPGCRTTISVEINAGHIFLFTALTRKPPQSSYMRLLIPELIDVTRLFTLHDQYRNDTKLSLILGRGKVRLKSIAATIGHRSTTWLA